MIDVLAIITARPGQRETVLQAFRENVPAVCAEQGCIEYGAAVDVEGLGEIQTQFGPDTFVVIEKWASVDALKADAVAPRFRPSRQGAEIACPWASPEARRCVPLR
jgi:quinol monooxygenase YgiN